MKIEKIIIEINERFHFFEKNYDIKFWNLSDKELYDFLSICYNNYFEQTEFVEFRQCMLDFFNQLFLDAMSDNRVIIDKSLLINDMFYLKYICKNTDFQKKYENIKNEVLSIFDIKQKKLTKNINYNII